MDRKTPFAIGEYYHLYNRGTEKRDIFLADRDRVRFACLLYLCNSTRHVNTRQLFDDLTFKGLPFALRSFDRGESIVDVGCWCAMPNHFHLLLKEKQDGGITKFMLKLTTAYSMYFNNLSGRNGRLFQGPFQSKHINDDKYLRYIFAYIHLNPVKLIEPNWKEDGIRDKERAKQFLDEYQFSSYLDFVESGRDWELIINKAAFPPYFSAAKDFDDLMNDWLNYKG